MRVIMTVWIILSTFLVSPQLFSQQNASVLPYPYGQGKYITSHHGKIYYEADGEGTPVIMINGGPGASRTVFWGALDFLKADGYQIVYFDETGVGRATRKIESKHSPMHTVQDIETLRKHLGADKVVIAGHSYGGIPALQYALKYPQRVEKLLMLSASADAISQQMNVDSAAYLRKTFFPVEWEKMKAMRADGLLTSDDRYLDAFYRHDMDEMSDWYDSKNASKLWKYDSKDKRDRFSVEVYFDVAGRDAEVEITGTLKGINVTSEQLKTLQIPILILNGRYDWKTTPAMAYRFYKMLPDNIAQLEFLEKTGHWTWIEEPDEFAKIVADFMASQ